MTSLHVNHYNMFLVTVGKPTKEDRIHDS